MGAPGGDGDRSLLIGPEASSWPQAVLRGDYGEIRVGARTSIQDGTVLHTTETHPTVIGADCVVGDLAHLEGRTVVDNARRYRDGLVRVS